MIDELLGKRKRKPSKKKGNPSSGSKIQKESVPGASQERSSAIFASQPAKSTELNHENDEDDPINNSLKERA